MIHIFYLFYFPNREPFVHFLIVLHPPYREDCISIGMKKKKRGGKKFDSKSFSGTAPFHSFPSYDTHKSPIEHMEVWMTLGNFPLVPPQVNA